MRRQHNNISGSIFAYWLTKAQSLGRTFEVEQVQRIIVMIGDNEGFTVDGPYFPVHMNEQVRVLGRISNQSSGSTILRFRVI